MVEQSLDATIGANVRKYREVRDLSQAEVARLVGMGFQQQTIVKIEKGVRPLRFTEAVRLAEVLNVALQDLHSYRAGVEQLLGQFATVRELFDQLHAAVEQIEDWRTAMVAMVASLDEEGIELQQDLRDGLEKYSRDDLVEAAVAVGRESFRIKVSGPENSRG